MEPNWVEALLGSHIYRLSLPAVSPVSCLLLLAPLYFLRRRGKSAGYLLCFYLFSVYAWAVLALTIVDFPLSSVEIAIMRARGWAPEINLVPGPFSGKLDVSNELFYGNFLLGIPFGLGLPFVVALPTHRRTILVGLGFAAGIEVAQALLGLALYQAPYRVFDVDDIWLVFAGTLAGYGGLWAVARLYRWLGWKGGARLPVWDHLHEVLLRVASGGARPPDTAAPKRQEEHGAEDGEGRDDRDAGGSEETHGAGTCGPSTTT